MNKGTPLLKIITLVNVLAFKRKVFSLDIIERNENGHYNISDVITWLLSRDSMSPKKLQKLLYYAYSWTLALENEDINQLDNKLFNRDFEAWVHGPVVADVYHDYKKYGFNDIPKVENSNIVFSDDVEDILNQVWDIYGHYTGNELESMTHQEEPWLECREGLSPIEPSRKKISNKTIFSYYLNEMHSENE